MAVKIQMRRDTAANWTSNNPTLSAGEIGFETDTYKLKIGNGSTAWTSLAYFGGTETRKIGSISVATNDIEIDFEDLSEFVSSNRVAVSANATISFANAPTTGFATFKVTISNLSTLTFPTNSVSGDSRVISRVFTPTTNGAYNVSIYLTSGEYDVVISQNPSL